MEKPTTQFINAQTPHRRKYTTNQEPIMNPQHMAAQAAWVRMQ